MKRTFVWTNSEKLALEVLAQICRAEGDLFGFASIDPTSIKNGSWKLRDGWKVRKVSRTVTFEETVRFPAIRHVAIELEGIQSEKEYADGGRWWHPTQVHYSWGAEKSEYVYKDPSVDTDPFQAVANWEHLYKVLEGGSLLHVSSGQAMSAST